jgi:hypothetical protein
MQPVILSGQAMGTVVSATDSTDLAGLNTQGLAIGSKAWNVAVGAYFTLTLSSASLVTNQVVAVNGLTGVRWIKDSVTGNAITSLTGGVVASGPGASAAVVTGFDPWWTSAVTAAKTLGLTEWSPAANLTNPLNYGGSTSDPGVAGGAVAPGAGNTAYFPTDYVIQNAKGTPWLFRCRFKQSALASGGNAANVGLGSTHRIYLSDSATAPVAGNWFVQLYAGGSVVKVDTGVAANTNWNDLEISHASSGANVIYKLNGTQVASVADTELTTTAVTGVITPAGTMAQLVRKYFWAVDASSL